MVPWMFVSLNGGHLKIKDNRNFIKCTWSIICWILPKHKSCIKIKFTAIFTKLNQVDIERLLKVSIHSTTATTDQSRISFTWHVTFWCGNKSYFCWCRISTPAFPTKLHTGKEVTLIQTTFKAKFGSIWVQIEIEIP